MGDNLPNIDIPVGEWVNLYSLSGITVGSALHVENVGSFDIYLAVQATQPAIGHQSYNVIQRGNGIRLQNALGASGAWAFCNNIGGKVAVGIAQQDGFFENSGAAVPVVSVQNSTSTPLAAGGGFTGEWVDVVYYGIAYVSVYSDVASATDGLIVQQSLDGINAFFHDEYTVPALSGKVFAINPHGHYMRIVYTNGATPQTVFQLSLKLNPNGLPSSHRVKDDLLEDDDAVLNKSILMTRANSVPQYKDISLGNPIPVNSGRLYQSDVNLDHSDMGTFSGTPIDLLDDRWSTITDTTSNNPKIIKIEFERAIQTSIFGITTESGSFSNAIIKYGVTTSPDIILLDDSADSSAKTLLQAPSYPITLTRIILEFHTANPVTLSGMDMSKSTQTIAQITGIDPDGELRAVNVSHIGNFHTTLQEYGDTSAIDSFARQRFSQPYTLYDSKQLHDKQPLFWDERLGGSATSVHVPADACTVMTVTASASDYGIRQTKQRPNYQPGKGQLYVMTSHFPQQTGIRIRVGAFDGTGTNYLTPRNGIFFEVTEDSISWNIAKNGTIAETVEQNNWNYDKMDGSGPSQVTLNLSAVEIIFFDYEWLGVGRVRCGVFVAGIPRYMHTFLHANNPAFTSVYMSTPNLPMRYSIESDGTGGGTLDHICGTVISEGGIQETGILRSVNTGTTHLDANLADTKYAILAIKILPTYYDITVYPEYFSMISETNDDFKWTIELNPTIDGTFTYSAVTQSAVEYARGDSTNLVSADGIIIDSGFSKSSATIDRKIITSLRMGATIAGVMDALVLTATPLSSNADLQASLTYRELL